MARAVSFDEPPPGGHDEGVSEPLEPFALFCAYHLGLGRDGRFRHGNVHDVARRFGVDVTTIQQALDDWGMSPARMIELDFDLASAQLDIQASPPGVDLPSIARMHFDLFVEAKDKPRDWEAERLEDERINAETFKKP
jgi:endonuclease/exonuclease/phosphatase family metal-dependent hydrolase